jgi:hypothetical protein
LILLDIQSTTGSAFQNPSLLTSLRSLFEKLRQAQDNETLQHDVQNVITFLRSQREYKVRIFASGQLPRSQGALFQALLARYNPLVDLTAQERIRATARRVGLDMPIAPKTQGEH